MMGADKDCGMSRALLEVCVDTPDGIALAAAAGADRIELCSALDLGGLTPGAGLIAAAKGSGIPVHAMIRPRAGDFRAGEADLAAMLDDIRHIRVARLSGVVIGVADGSGALDRAALARLVDAAGPLDVTLHRVIDLTPDPIAALEVAVSLGIRRILTSGGARIAPDGVRQIAAMVRAARGRIEIMAGGGLTPANAPMLVATGIGALHASCRSDVAGGSGWGFGATRRTDPQKIVALRRAMTPETALP